MTNEQGFAVQTQELRRESAEWRHRVRNVDEARTLLATGTNHGASFGTLANRYAGIGQLHDQLVSTLCSSLSDGRRTFLFIAACLASAADTYDGVDATVAQSAAELRKRLGP